MLRCDNKPENEGGCTVICDFCMYYQNGHDLGLKNIENGYCLKHKKEAYIIGHCEDFCCFMVGRKESIYWWLRCSGRLFKRRWKYRFNKLIRRIKNVSNNFFRL